MAGSRHVQCRLVGCLAERGITGLFQGYLNSRDEAPRRVTVSRHVSLVQLES